MTDTNEHTDILNLLHQDAERFQLLSEAAFEGIFIHKDGIILELNSPLCEIFGYAREELLGKMGMEFMLTPESRNQALSHIGANTPEPYELVGIRKNGEHFPFEVQDKEIEFNGHKMRVAAIRDISKRKHAEIHSERNAQLLSEIVDLVPHMIFAKYEDGTFFLANKAIADGYGVTVDDVVGHKHVDVHLNPDEVAEMLAYDAEVLETNAPKVIPEQAFTDHAGDVRLLYVSKIPFTEPGTGRRAVLGVGVDMTDQIKLDRVKNEFVSLASHQLRTPITIMAWQLEALRDREYHGMSDDQRGKIDQIHQGVTRMQGLVKDLLHISRMELGRVNVQPEFFSVPVLVEELLKTLTITFNDKDITVIKEIPDDLPLLKTDRSLLEIVLQNLLSNARNYTPKGGTITIGVTTPDDECMRISVSDTGYGIPKEQQDKIFTKFFRADNAKRIDANGTGLGLYMVKSILRENKGRVWFESEQNEGTTFFVELPIDPTKTQTPAK